MPSLTAIAAALTSLQALKDLAQAMVGLGTTEALQAKRLEFQQALLDAQGSLFAANEERSALIARVRELEEELTRMKAWETEKHRYELQRVGIGAFAYALKREAKPPEPPHWLCARCYQDDKKSLLQFAGVSGSGTIWQCPRCSSKMYTHENTEPT